MIGLSDIFGQEEAIGRIQAALRAGRMPHALLFAGPEGVGRRTTAEAMGATLLCSRPAGPAERPGRSGPFSQACGECEDCRLMDAGLHGDFQVVRKELAAYHDDPEVRKRKMQELGIPVVQQFLLEPACRAPVRGKGRVFVVLEAELLSDPAQNALLKTLEEPHPGVTIVLICSQPEQLLPTTRSRCWWIPFRLLPVELVAGKLRDQGVPDEEARFWASFTGGSLGRALRLHARELYPVKRELVDCLADGDRAAELGDMLDAHAQRLADKFIAEIGEDCPVELARSVATRRAGETLLQMLASAVRDAMVLPASGDEQAGARIANADQLAAVEALSRRFDALGLAGILEQLGDCEELLWRNVNQRLLWDNVAVTCAGGPPLRV